MKTTVEMPDALYQEARSWAAQNGWTIKVVLEESLRQFLESRSKGHAASTTAWRPVVFGGQGLQTPGMTFNEMRELAERPHPILTPRKSK